jgi:hypothetical protein
LTSWSMKYMNIDCFRELCIAFPPMIRDHVRLTFIQWMAVADYERTSVHWLHVAFVNRESCAMYVDRVEQCHNKTTSPPLQGWLVLILRACYSRVDRSKERTEYMCVTARECSCSRHI